MFEPSITIDGSPERLETPRKPKQPVTAVEYEYRCAEYEYDKQPTAAKLRSSSYSVRPTDGTRNRTRCSEPSSMMFGTNVMLAVSLAKLDSTRNFNSPTNTEQS
jgi:hypothetical protein